MKIDENDFFRQATLRISSSLDIKKAMRKALDQANGRVEGENGAASMLGINPGTLRGRMKKLKISYGRSSHKKRYG